MYSGFRDVRAASPQEARAKCPPQFDAPNYAPAVAIRLGNAQSDEEKAWLKTHVG